MCVSWFVRYLFRYFFISLYVFRSLVMYCVRYLFMVSIVRSFFMYLFVISLCIECLSVFSYLLRFFRYICLYFVRSVCMHFGLF